MLKNRSTLSIAILLLSWFAVQTSALHHEYSAEHLLSTNNHVCFSQAVHLDDVFHSDPCEKVLPLVQENTGLSYHFDNLVTVRRFLPQNPRAPPVIS